MLKHEIAEYVSSVGTPKKRETFVGGSYAPEYSHSTEWETSMGRALKEAAAKVVNQRTPVSGNLAKGFC